MGDFEDLKDFDGYKINEFGIIKNRFGKIMAKHKSREKCGYFRISLTKNGESKKYALHRLLAKQYIPNPNNLLEIDHIDRNSFNNNLCNLRWCNRVTNAGNKNVKGNICEYNNNGYTHYKGTYHINLKKKVQKSSYDRNIIEEWLNKMKIQHPR